MSDSNSKPDGHAGHRSHRILLIQDDNEFARLLADYLGSHGFLASNAEPEQGVAQARTQAWDLIVLDVMLTRAQGSEVLRQLRASSIVPLLVLAGDGADKELIAGLERGVDSYLHRSASLGELVAHIRALLPATAIAGCPEVPPTESDQTGLSIGSLRLEPKAHAVFLDGTALALSSVEFHLLASLMRHKGNIRTRAELLSEVRGRGCEIYDQSLDAHFGTLRRKFRERAHSARFILRIRGVGYVLTEPRSVKD
jgi:two-component system, OmpR family, response regulator CpxR